VWTPKRICLLVAGFLLFLTAYAVYAHFLGGIDGLKPLPEDYKPVTITNPLPEQPDTHSSTDLKLRQAFGEENPRLEECKIKMELQSGIVMATHDFSIEPDGRVRLTKFFIAIFGKHLGENGYPEINTVRSEVAFLRFDKPISNIFEMSSRKIVGGELEGEIYIINNRRTPQRDDDVCLFTQGPLFYQESRHQVWTDKTVRVTDLQSKPKPIIINGTGMDLYLTADPPAAAADPKGRKPHTEGPSGVDRIELRNDVDMNLWVDAHSGLLASGKGPADHPNPPAAGQALPEKAKVVIRTQGPFRYDMRTKFATFDISQQAGLRNIVSVDRINETEHKYDNLLCDHLEIQFHPNPPPGPAPAPAPAASAANPPTSPSARDNQAGEGLSIESAHATGKEVILKSDAENLVAYGNDFFFNNLTKCSTLKGSPKIWAMRDGSLIEAPELQLVEQKGGQQATALGEGNISMFDTKKNGRPLEAKWKKKLVYGKDGNYDLLVLEGDASFVNVEKDKDGKVIQSQELQGDLIKVWLEPPDKAAPPKENEQQQRKPHHVEAVGRVNALSDSMHVHDTDHLIIRFKDVPALAGTPVVADGGVGRPVPSATAGTPPDAADSHVVSKPSTVPPNPTAHEGTPNRSAPSASTPGKTPPPAHSKKPIDLSARLVEVDVLRSPEKNDLDKLWCEGMVKVHQDPETPEDRGVDIRGQTMQLTHHADGNVLAVTGDHAQVQLNKIFILGSEVNIDQTSNESWVNGAGIMRMLSTANFDGTKLEKPTELTVTWDKSMFFNGHDAKFQGLVRAAQDNGHLACDAMQVTFDRTISLKEGDKGTQPARVQDLLCNTDVWLEDSKYEGFRLLAYRRIDCPQLTVDNEAQDESIVHASGPGVVRLFQLGNKDEGLPGPGTNPAPRRPAQTEKKEARPAKAATKADEQEFKLTYTSYQGKMYANNKSGMATFWDHVVVIHLPTDNPHLPIDELRPPKGSMYLSCEQLEVFNHKSADGKTSTQEMLATKKVVIEGQDYSGRADKVKYDESKGQLILEGENGNMATLYQVRRGEEGKQIRGKKIFYYPQTGDFHGEDITTFKVDR
jgi:hypothetical protein